MIRMRWCPTAAVAAVVFLVGQACQAQVIDSRWIDDTSGTWVDPDRWSTPEFPSARGPDTYRAIIDFDAGGPYTISLSSAIDLDQLVYTSGDATIDGGGVGTLTVRTDIELGDATITALADLMSEGTLRFTGDALCEIDDTPSCHVGSVARKTGTGDIAFLGSTVFELGSATTFTIENSGDFIGDTTALLRNDGTFTKQSPGLTLIEDVQFENNGTIVVQQGTLEITNPVLPSPDTLGPAIYDVADGATLDLRGRTLTTNQASVFLRGPDAVFRELSAVDLNQGLVQVVSGANVTFSATSGLRNEGDLIAAGAGSSIRTTSPLVNAGGTITVQGGGEVLAGGPGLSNEGVVQGEGTIDAETFVNNGVVSPGNSPGVLVTENASGTNHVFQQGTLGTLLIEIEGRTPGIDHDVLDVRGIALINGTLDLRFAPFSGEPQVQPGDQFNIIFARGVDGAFQDVRVRGLGTEGQVDVFLNPNGVVVVVREVPTPGVLAVLGLGALAASRRRR